MIDLAKIHQYIEEVVGLKETEPSVEMLLTAFSLASIFIVYFRRYDLSHETWGCQLAWMHLLRLRYHAIIRLYERQGELDNSDQKESLKPNLLLARRDWTDFCTNVDNHFLFSRENQQKYGGEWPRRVAGVEDEVIAIICPSGGRRPYRYYLTDEGGTRVLDGLIANWFLSSRYNWLGACQLAWHRCRQYLWYLVAGVAGVIVTAALLMISQWCWPGAVTGWGMLSTWIYVLTQFSECISLFGREIWQKFLSSDTLSIILALSYPLLLALLIWCICWRTVMDLLLPRVWAGVMVGYLPLFITSEVWKIAYDHKWWWREPKGLLLLNVIGAALVFSYLRWEVSNRLARTPELYARVPIRRALWLTIYGWSVSVISGLVLFSITGNAMARACLTDSSGQFTEGTLILFSHIHLSALFLFAPFALLIGVVLQIFWEDKPITHPA